MSERKRILNPNSIPAFYYSLSALISGIIHFVYLVWIIRTISSDDYGTYIFVIVTISILTFFIDAGLNRYLHNDILVSKSATSKMLGDIIFAKFLLFLMLLFIFILIVFIKYENDIKANIKIGFAIIIFNSFIASISSNYESIFRSLNRYKIISFQSIISKLLTFVFAITLMYFFPTIISLFLAITASTLIIFSFLLYNLNKYNFKSTFTLNFKESSLLVLKSIPLSIKDFNLLVLSRGEICIINMFMGTSGTAIYGVSHSIIRGISFLPRAIGSRLFSFTSENNERMDMIRICYTVITLNFLMGFPIFFAGILLADEFVEFLFGGNYIESIFIIRILLAPLFLSFINIPLRQLLIQFKEEKALARVTGIATLVFIVLNIIFIPLYGLIASAIISALTQVLIYFLTTMTLKGYKHYVLLKPAIIPFISSLFMFLVMIDFSKLHILLKIPIGLLSYIISALALGLIFRRETTIKALNSIKKAIFI